MKKTTLLAAVLFLLELQSARAGSMRLRARHAESQVEIEKHIQLYESTVAKMDANPLLFQKQHWFFFGILTDQTFMNQVVKRWEAHEGRFDIWHPYLWRMLDGYVHEPHVVTPPVTPPVLDPPPPGSLPGVSPGTKGGGTGQTGGNGGDPGSGGHGHPGGGGGGGIGSPQAVPEPPGFVMLLTGAILAGIGSVRKLIWGKAHRAIHAGPHPAASKSQNSKA